MNIAVVDSNKNLIAYISDKHEDIVKYGYDLLYYGDNEPVFTDEDGKVTVNQNKFVISSITRGESEEKDGDKVKRQVYEQVMWERDIAIQQLKELGYEFGEKIRTDGDTISRQAAIDACDQSINLFEAVDRIKELPPVNPQEPKSTE